MLREDAGGLDGGQGEPTATRSWIGSELPQLLEEVGDEDDALWLRIIAFRDRGTGGSSCEDYATAVDLGLGFAAVSGTAWKGVPATYGWCGCVWSSRA